MTRLSKSLLFEAKANVRPFIEVSVGEATPSWLLCAWRTMKLKSKISSSSLLRRTMKDGNVEVGEASGS